MSHMIDLSPETEARLNEAAQAQNVPVDELLRQVVEQSSFGTASNAKQRGKGETESRSLLELDGLGAGMWKNIDAQEYVNKLRETWGDTL